MNLFGLEFVVSYKLLYAYVTYIGLSTLHLVNVPYGAGPLDVIRTK